MHLNEFKHVFDPFLKKFIQEKIKESNNFLPDQEMQDLVSYLIPYIDHGKRFRPYMVYLWYMMYSGNDLEMCMKYGCVNELIHIFALIHDDICDEGTLRHKIPTYHKELGRRYANEHVGISQAMILGDLIYTRALELLSQCSGTEKVNKIYFSLLKEVILGQLQDVHFSHENTLRSLDEIEMKDHLKSGQYTFQKPMMIGAILGGASQKDQEIIGDIGRNLGVAFQWRDDLLDRLPNTEGKTPMSDIQEGNQTSVLLELHMLLNDDDWNMFFSSRGKDLTQPQKDKLLALVKKSNLREHMITRIGKKLDVVVSAFDTSFGSMRMGEKFLDIVSLLRTV